LNAQKDKSDKNMVDLRVIESGEKQSRNMESGVVKSKDMDSRLLRPVELEIRNVGIGKDGIRGDKNLSVKSGER